SGAQNWEAWIQDARDNKIYRIAQLSTGLWTMDDYLNYAHPAAVDEKCSNADPNAKEYWRHTLATTYSTLCPDGWRLPEQTELKTTFDDWSQYLSKIKIYTGETIRIPPTTSCQLNGEYVALIAKTCIGIGYYGGRLKNPTSAASVSGIVTCLRYTSGTNSTNGYSGYVRCVREE
ncbi:MAG: hypothetical protein LBU42_04985, partial [Prevotellaceae bacterium]|nr:hypothetical protein [Prevotellaceae bacterium]